MEAGPRQSLIYIFFKKRSLTEKAEPVKSEKDPENHGKVRRTKCEKKKGGSVGDLNLEGGNRRLTGHR